MKSNGKDDKGDQTGDESAERIEHFARKFGIAGNAMVTVERPGKHPSRMRLSDFLRDLRQQKLFE